MSVSEEENVTLTIIITLTAQENLWVPVIFYRSTSHGYGRHGVLMVSALASRLSGPGSSPGRGHCVVFLGKTLYSHSASLHPGV